MKNFVSFTAKICIHNWRWKGWSGVIWNQSSASC